MACQKCIDRWGQEPSSWGDSVVELNDYATHMREHVGKSIEEYPPVPLSTYSDDDYPCTSGCKPSEGDVCGGPRCT